MPVLLRISNAGASGIRNLFVQITISPSSGVIDVLNASEVEWVSSYTRDFKYELFADYDDCPAQTTPRAGRAWDRCGRLPAAYNSKSNSLAAVTFVGVAAGMCYFAATNVPSAQRALRG